MISYHRISATTITVECTTEQELGVVIDELDMFQVRPLRRTLQQCAAILNLADVHELTGAATGTGL